MQNLYEALEGKLVLKCNRIELGGPVCLFIVTRMQNKEILIIFGKRKWHSLKTYF